jgi:serine/threonine protein kinase
MLYDLSKADVIHRDIKVENILLTDNDVLLAQPKLGDFGLATYGESALMRTR